MTAFRSRRRRPVERRLNPHSDWRRRISFRRSEEGRRRNGGESGNSTKHVNPLWLDEKKILRRDFKDPRTTPHIVLRHVVNSCKVLVTFSKATSGRAGQERKCPGMDEMKDPVDQILTLTALRRIAGKKFSNDRLRGFPHVVFHCRNDFCCWLKLSSPARLMSFLFWPSIATVSCQATQAVATFDSKSD